jgi:actin cytoskeleton-regulatory complex protein PAN1
VQRITRYPLLIKQILQYTEPDQDRALTERALHTAERLLDTINEAIREQEGRNKLRILSQDLWIGHGYVTPIAWSNICPYLQNSPGGWT